MVNTISQYCQSIAYAQRLKTDLQLRANESVRWNASAPARNLVNGAMGRSGI